MSDRRKHDPKRALCAFVFGFLLTVGIPQMEHATTASMTAATSTDSELTASELTASEQAVEAQPPANVYTVSPDVLAVEIAAPTVTLGQQVAYEPASGDEIVIRDERSHLKRNGQIIGILLGPEQSILYPYDAVGETAFQPQQADQVSHYAIASNDDPHYATAQQPNQVSRKSKPVALSHEADGSRQWPAAHTLYLTLPQPLLEGKTYQLTFSDLGIENTIFTHQPTTARSEAVHVSQLGFRPTDSFKAGYLSTWMGSGGGLDYPDSVEFSLIDTQSAQVAYQGSSIRRRGEYQIEDGRDRDYTLTEVHQLDFSDFRTPGQYRLCVDNIGCSFDFPIDSTVWHQAFRTTARGFYHQRSGIPIGPPHSDFRRPRAFHPDDGVKIYQSTVSLLEVDMGIGDQDTFSTLFAGKTDTEVANAWGGYFDAGDWDRRIQHLAVPRSLMELYSLFPGYFASIDLNVPESNNALPDIFDEALWSLDFFRRLQTAEGGIRGGIESAEHPLWGETSWQESLTVMAYAPDVWSSYLYAGVAARAAYTLKDYDSQLAETYTDSALRAMAYAEANYVASDYVAGEYPEGKLLHHVGDQRNLAALELYRLTRDPQWHDLFLATTVFTDDYARVFTYTQQAQADAAFLYARLDDTFAVDSQIQAYARAAFLRHADELVGLTETTAFGWSRRNPDAPVGWPHGLGGPTAGPDLLRAHVLTGDANYLRAAISSTQFAAGANPDNMVYTTGMGARHPQNPMIADYRVTGQAPPPGITLYGPTDFTHYSDYWVLDNIDQTTFPESRTWPTAESHFDIYSNVISSEFTVDSMVDAAYTWGYLAARDN